MLEAWSVCGKVLAPNQQGGGGCKVGSSVGICTLNASLSLFGHQIICSVGTCRQKFGLNFCSKMLRDRLFGAQSVFIKVGGHCWLGRRKEALRGSLLVRHMHCMNTWALFESM